MSKKPDSSQHRPFDSFEAFRDDGAQQEDEEMEDEDNNNNNNNNNPYPPGLPPSHGGPLGRIPPFGRGAPPNWSMLISVLENFAL
jgi:hypothetical protein